jgi:hypothetical protein
MISAIWLPCILWQMTNVDKRLELCFGDVRSLLIRRSRGHLGRLDVLALNVAHQVRLHVRRRRRGRVGGRSSSRGHHGLSRGSKSDIKNILAVHNYKNTCIDSGIEQLSAWPVWGVLLLCIKSALHKAPLSTPSCIHAAQKIGKLQ